MRFTNRKQYIILRAEKINSKKLRHTFAFSASKWTLCKTDSCRSPPVFFPPHVETDIFDQFSLQNNPSFITLDGYLCAIFKSCHKLSIRFLSGASQHECASFIRWRLLCFSFNNSFPLATLA